MAAPIKHTCPEIGVVIEYIRSAEKNANIGRKTGVTLGEAQAYMSDIADDLSGLETRMEDLRKANATLREWGEEMEKERNVLQDEITAYKSTIQDLQNDLQREIDFSDGL